MFHVLLQRIELTDGWYSIPAKLDHHLIGKIQNGTISIGYKLFICGAQLENTDTLGHPLEVNYHYL